MEKRVRIRKRVRHGLGKSEGDCMFDGCDQVARCRGYCCRHYEHQKSRGLIVAAPKRTEDERFRSSFLTNEETGCWEWIKGTSVGYGWFTIGSPSRRIRAHQYAYLTFVGEIPQGLCVCHRCDNRKCCNPDHLFLGTHGDNMRDCVSKNRHAAANGNAGKKLSDKMILNIRIMYARSDANSIKLAEIYGVSQSHISSLLAGKSRL